MSGCKSCGGGAKTFTAIPMPSNRVTAPVAPAATYTSPAPPAAPPTPVKP